LKKCYCTDALTLIQKDEHKSYFVKKAKWISNRKQMWQKPVALKVLSTIALWETIPFSLILITYNPIGFIELKI